jgi:hypothetical protein
MLEFLIEGTYKFAVMVVSSDMIYIPSFMNIGIGFEAILRFCLSNLMTVMLILSRVRGLYWIIGFIGTSITITLNYNHL